LALGSELAFALLAPMTFGVAEIASGDRPHVADIGNYLLGTSISMVAVLSAILNGFFEELIVRGYLMTEVKRFTGSIVFAILCSVAVQTSYHFYQGGPTALAHVGTFMVFAVYYAKTNRILPPILAHAALDLNALVMYALRLISGA
jgi:membrane protease YdiL (CAAX protease family)